MWRMCYKIGKLNIQNVLNISTRRFSKKFIEVNEEIESALQDNYPVVALESTIFTHGMPYPNSYECALDAEASVREMGAVPATIGIIGGKIKVGLTDEEKLLLIKDINTIETVKTSRRDFGYVLSKKLNGGTTVAGTLIVANMVGIPVFATGGIGGVHREGENTFDISADLTELGKSSVAVISSGVKSILDIPKTLEYLETQGVFVATYGENKDFPAFYSRRSGSQAPYNVQNAREAAGIIRCHLELGLNSGLLFAVPVPDEYAMKEDEMNALVEQAMKSAKKARISGKDITPHLLATISHLTKGSSLECNMALMKNNARVAADIAVHLAQLQPKVYSRKNIRNINKLNETKHVAEQPVSIN